MSANPTIIISRLHTVLEHCKAFQWQYVALAYTWQPAWRNLFFSALILFFSALTLRILLISTLILFFSALILFFSALTLLFSALILFFSALTLRVWGVCHVCFGRYVWTNLSNTAQVQVQGLGAHLKNKPSLSGHDAYRLHVSYDMYERTSKRCVWFLNMRVLPPEPGLQ